MPAKPAIAKPQTFRHTGLTPPSVIPNSIRLKHCPDRPATAVGPSPPVGEGWGEGGKVYPRSKPLTRNRSRMRSGPLHKERWHRTSGQSHNLPAPSGPARINEPRCFNACCSFSTAMSRGFVLPPSARAAAEAGGLPIAQTGARTALRWRHGSSRRSGRPSSKLSTPSGPACDTANSLSRRVRDWRELKMSRRRHAVDGQR